MTHQAVVLIPVEKLVVTEESKRYQDRNALTRLALNIRSTSQIAPLLVRRLAETDTYEVIVGGRRTISMRMAGETLAHCIVVDKELSPAEVIKLRWSENAQRVDLNPMEEARLAIEFMEASGLSQKQAARELGVTDTDVSRYVERLRDWCDELRMLVESGFPASNAHAIHAIKDPDKLREALQRAAERKITRDEAISMAHESKNGSPPAEKSKVSRFKVALEMDAATITGPELTPERVVGLLAELLKRARKAMSRGLSGNAFVLALRDAS